MAPAGGGPEPVSDEDLDMLDLLCSPPGLDTVTVAQYVEVTRRFLPRLTAELRRRRQAARIPPPLHPRSNPTI